MVENIIKNIKNSHAFVSSSFRIFKAESYISDQLRNVSLKYKDIQIGSYPFKENDQIGVEIVVRHLDQKYVQKVLEEIRRALNER